MTNAKATRHRAILQEIARRAMLERGLLPDFSPEARAELDTIRSAALPSAAPARDLQSRIWCSIDNDDSRALDQLTVAEPLPGDALTILVSSADVYARV